MLFYLVLTPTTVVTERAVHKSLGGRVHADEHLKRSAFELHIAMAALEIGVCHHDGHSHRNKQDRHPCKHGYDNGVGVFIASFLNDEHAKDNHHNQ